MGGGSGSTTSTTTSKPPKAFQNAYTGLLGQIQGTASQPLQQYSGQIVAPFNAAQQQGFDLTNAAAGSNGYSIAEPYFNQAQTDFSNATTPLWNSTMQFSPDAVQQYESPYTQDVVNATQNQFNLQNAQQQQQLAGSTAAAGAFGGDRQAVAQSQLAGQQQANQAPVIAGLENQGYSQALGEFNTQQQNELGANEANAWLGSQAAFGESALGNEAQTAAYTGAGQEEAIGGEQQQLAQENLNVPYEQFLQQQAYPFQTEGWLASLETGLGDAAGGTSTASSDPSTLSQITGGLESAAGIAGMFLNRGGGINVVPFPKQRARQRRAGGGDIFADEAAEMPTASNSGLPAIPNVDVSIVGAPPQFSGRGPGIPTAHLPSSQSSSGPSSGGGSLFGNSDPAGLGAYSNNEITNMGSASNQALGAAEIGDLETSLPMLFERGGEVQHFDDGGSPQADDDVYTPFTGHVPANDQTPPPQPQQATGTNGMPFPNMDYKPHQMPDTWSKDEDRAPWLGLLAAGAETLGTGNIGRGITAGLRSYMGVKNDAAQRQSKAQEYNDDQSYKQADVEERANQFFDESQNRASELKEKTAHDASEENHWNLEFQASQAPKYEYEDPSKTGGAPAIFNPKDASLKPITAGDGTDPYTAFAAKMVPTENSTGNRSATNKRSSAAGDGQFLDSTWLQMVKQTRPELVSGPNAMSDQQLLALRSDPGMSLEMTAQYARQNAQSLTAAGAPVTTGTLALAHRLGPQDALKVLSADPATPLAKLLSPKVIAANPDMTTATAGGYARNLIDKVGNDPIAASGTSPQMYGKFGDPVTVEVGDGNGATKQVLAQQNKTTGQWVSADQNRTPINGNDMRIVSTQNSGGGRSAAMIGRQLTDAKDASSDLANIAAMPITASTGWFGNRGANGGTSLLHSTFDVLANKVTPQDIQSYNVSAVGLGRALAGLETGGMQVNQGLMDQFEKLQLADGDTQLTKMQKLASMRQQATNALETAIVSPYTTADQKKYAKSMIADMAHSIPWSPRDVIALEYANDPNATLSSVAQKLKLSQASAQATPQHAASPSAQNAPAPAVAYLRANPNQAGAFDKKYGAGAAEHVLGAQ